MLQKKQWGQMLIIGFLFFVFGFISWLNAILIPYFKLSLQLTIREAMMVAFAFYISYFVMALPSSRILELTGLKKGMMLGLFIMAAGALLFIPAARFRSYPLFLFGLFIQATGLTLLQTASNPYVTILGPIESAARRMSIMGVCSKVAGALAPLILLKSITKRPEEIDEIKALLPGLLPSQATIVLDGLTLRLIAPYGMMAIILSFLGLVIHFSGLPDIKNRERQKLTEGSIFHFPHLMLGVLAIFCGVSVEVLSVDTIIGYAQYQGYTFVSARYFATYTLLIMIGGYMIGILAIPRYLSQRMALIYCALAGAVLVLGILLTKGNISVWSVALLGCCNALIWPSIWPLALKNLGHYTEKGSALLIMGIAGGAVTPLLFAEVAGKTNLQWAYAITLPLYSFLLYYGYMGYRTRKSEEQLLTS